MARFYERRIVAGDGGAHYLVTVQSGSRGPREVEVPRDVYELLEDLQREFWRLERRESRHVWHIENMREGDLPNDRRVSTPEQVLVTRVENAELRSALESLAPVQRRRFLLHHLEDVPVKVLARMEGCSDRAIKYSLARARKNLSEQLSERTSQFEISGSRP